MTIRKPGYSIEHDSWFIPLTQGVIALVDGNMVPVLAQHNWYAHRARGQWSARRRDPSTSTSQTLCMHRVCMDAPNEMVIDHISHHPLSYLVIDNRRSNLRSCSHANNIRNSRPMQNTSSAFKGVCWNRQCGKWMAQIRLKNKTKYLGLFTNEHEAARAYDAAAIEGFGEFALTNSKVGLLPDGGPS